MEQQPQDEFSFQLLMGNLDHMQQLHQLIKI